MAVKYDDIYNSEYTKALGNSVRNLEASQTQAETALKKSYDASSAKLKQNRDTALREAYISKMKEERAAPSTLARQGLSGGYAESNQAAITRNYQNNRAAAEKNYADNLTNVDVSYNSDLASLKSQYADAIANAKQNAISQALNSAAQRYNALKAEEEEAKAAAGSAARAASYSGGGTTGSDTTDTEEGARLRDVRVNTAGYADPSSTTVASTKVETSWGKKYLVSYNAAGKVIGRKVLSGTGANRLPGTQAVKSYGGGGSRSF